MFDTTCILLAVVVFWLTLQHAEGTTAHFRISPADADVIFTDHLVFSVDARSRIDCARTCLNSDGCVTFTYTSLPSAFASCRGHTSSLTIGFSGDTLAPGSVVYVRAGGPFTDLSTTLPPSMGDGFGSASTIATTTKTGSTAMVTATTTKGSTAMVTTTAKTGSTAMVTATTTKGSTAMVTTTTTKESTAMVTTAKTGSTAMVTATTTTKTGSTAMVTATTTTKTGSTAMVTATTTAKTGSTAMVPTATTTGLTTTSGSASGWLNKHCTGTPCSNVAQTLCFENLCLCTPGYYYSHSGDSCVQTCAESDLRSDFTAYPRHYISGNNMQTLTGSTLQACLDSCLATPSCVTAEYQGQCYLQSVTALDVPFFSSTLEGITHYQRTCK